MNGLKQYVADKNQMNRIFKAKELDLSVAADRQKIADSLESDMSPENISCDGELSRARVQERYRHYTKAIAELKALDPSVKFYEYA